MAGTMYGGRQAARTIRKKYGKNFFKEIGRRGGQKGTTGGFASEVIGVDGLTGRQRAQVAGKIGGTKSRRNRQLRRKPQPNSN